MPDSSARDTNALVAALLRDLAQAQKSVRAGWGYKRAAKAVLNLDVPIESLLREDGSLGKIPNIGPKSEQVILEALRTRASPIVERAIEASGKTADIQRRRGLRSHYLSRSRVLAALNDDSLIGPKLADYHGDLQMHSEWSDGGQTLEEIVETGLERGYDYCGVTDHSYGLPIAGGLSIARLAEQHEEIDRINERYRRQFRLIKGIEANIRADGSVDMTTNELATLELVVAAPHSVLRSPADQTPRMIAAVKTPGVHILGHPRGRIYGSRPGVSAEWDDVFGAAAKAGVAVELDGDPARQDMDFALARRAIDAGCLFALDSDAHASSQLSYAETAIAHARLAGIPKDRVINCWPLDQLLEWLADVRNRSSRLLHSSSEPQRARRTQSTQRSSRAQSS
jgi:histidinol phosphatase-like PHP family hydrolase